jgi:hypothetical protein
MRVIHKFGPFNIRELNILENVHRIVHFAQGSDGLYVWCEKDKEKLRSRNIEILIVGTGWDYESSWEHQGTIIDKAGYVWHLLESKEFLGAPV